MRIIIFFDLPMETASDRREYTAFRKTIIRNGFVMMQKSVYSKIALNASMEASIQDMLRKNRPAKGSVQVLTVTEKQFASIKFLVGEYQTDVIDTDERLVTL